jgi:hypothetical protein
MKVLLRCGSTTVLLPGSRVLGRGPCSDRGKKVLPVLQQQQMPVLGYRTSLELGSTAER